MAAPEDRPIIVSGGDMMVRVTLPNAAKPHGGLHTLGALPASGPFKTIVFTRDDEEEFRTPADGNWTITIE